MAGTPLRAKMISGVGPNQLGELKEAKARRAEEARGLVFFSDSTRLACFFGLKQRQKRGSEVNNGDRTES